VPQQRSKPKRKLIVGLSLVTGLMLSLAAVFVRNFLAVLRTNLTGAAALALPGKE
jgi:uncharacterized protein involved in exopolysaccharide biosynthesis